MNKSEFINKFQLNGEPKLCSVRIKAKYCKEHHISNGGRFRKDLMYFITIRKVLDNKLYTDFGNVIYYKQIADIQEFKVCA